VATVVVDLADETQIAAAVRTSVARFGRLDILLNGVGGSSIRRPLVELDARDFAAVVELNLLAGCILPTKHVAQYWIAQGIRGAIINIASMGSYRPLSGGWAVLGGKGSRDEPDRGHARELAPTGSGSTPWPPVLPWQAEPPALGGGGRHADRSRPGRPGPHAAGPLRATRRAHRGRGLPRERRAGFVSGVTLRWTAPSSATDLRERTRESRENAAAA